MLNRNRLLSAQVTSGFSQWLDIFLIFAMPVFVWDATPEDIGIIALLLALPSLVISPVVGALVDAYNPYRIMQLGALLRVLSTLLIVINLSYDIFLGLVLFKGITNVIYWSSASVVTNQVVDSAHRMSYFSSFSAIGQTTKVLTPLVMIPIASLWTLKEGFVLSLLLCVVALFAVSTLSYTHTKRHQDVRVSYAKLFSGFKELKFMPNSLLVHIAFSMVLALSLAIYDPHLPSFVKSLSMGENTYSAIITATAVGAIAGALAVKSVFKHYNAVLLSKVGIFLFLLSIMIVNVLLLTSNNIPLFALVVIWFLNGCGYELFMIGYGVNFQNTCPEAILGKVSTSARSLQMLIIMLTPSVGAFLIAQVSFSAVFMTSLAVLCMSLCLLPFFKSAPLRAQL